MKTLLLLALSSLCFLKLRAATITAIGDGSTGWNVGANWDLNRVPDNGDIVVIPSGQTMDIKGNVYPSAVTLYIRVFGTLNFNPSGQLNLTSSSYIDLFNGGTIQSTNASSELILIGGVTKFEGGVFPSTISGPLYASSATGSLLSGFSFGVLPVSIIQFSGQETNNQITLHWTVSPTADIRSFVLQSSVNCADWAQLEEVPFTSGKTDYSATLGETGPNFYRVKIVSRNGQESYSTVLKPGSQQLLHFNIFPNPAVSSVHFTFRSPFLTPFTIQFFNSAGQVVFQRTYNEASSNTVVVDLSALPRGSYVVLCQSASFSSQSAVLIK